MGKVPEFWRVCGGPVLGIAAFVVLTLFNQLHAEVAELRREVAAEREAGLALVARADLDAALAEADADLAAAEDALGSLGRPPAGSPAPTPAY